MTIDQLRKVQKAEPFRPFTLHLADGRQHRVPHPEFIWVPPLATRTIFVVSEPDVAEFIDVLLITSIELSNGQPVESRS